MKPPALGTEIFFCGGRPRPARAPGRVNLSKKHVPVFPLCSQRIAHVTAIFLPFFEHVTTVLRFDATRTCNSYGDVEYQNQYDLAVSQ